MLRRRIKENGRSGQSVLELAIVFICLVLIVGGGVKLFSSLNLNMMHRMDVYQDSRKDAVNAKIQPGGNFLATQLTLRKSGIHEDKRGLSNPTSFLEYYPDSSYEYGAGTGDGIDATFSYRDPRLTEASILLRTQEQIMSFILRYKVNQAYHYGKTMQFEYDFFGWAWRWSWINPDNGKIVQNLMDDCVALSKQALRCFQDAIGKYQLALDDPIIPGPFDPFPELIPDKYGVDPQNAEDVAALVSEHALNRASIRDTIESMNSMLPGMVLMLYGGGSGAVAVFDQIINKWQNNLDHPKIPGPLDPHPENHPELYGLAANNTQQIDWLKDDCAKNRRALEAVIVDMKSQRDSIEDGSAEYGLIPMFDYVHDHILDSMMWGNAGHNNSLKKLELLLENFGKIISPVSMPVNLCNRIDDLDDSIDSNPGSMSMSETQNARNIALIIKNSAELRNLSNVSVKALLMGYVETVEIKLAAAISNWYNGHSVRNPYLLAAKSAAVSLRYYKDIFKDQNSTFITVPSSGVAGIINQMQAIALADSQPSNPQTIPSLQGFTDNLLACYEVQQQPPFKSELTELSSDLLTSLENWNDDVDTMKEYFGYAKINIWALYRVRDVITYPK